jgi:vitamin B12 transporter
MRGKNGVLAGLVTAVLIVLAPRRAGAQGGVDSATTKPHELAPIVVTATRVPIPAVTTATTVLSGEALRDQGITHLLDALRQVPGLAIVQTGSFGGQTSLYTRGGESGYTRVLIDGVPVNDPGGDFDFADLTTEDIDRIEIVRGPASVLYGTDAVTGVIQVFTRRGEGPPRITANLRGGNYGTTVLSGGVSGSTPTTSYAFDASRHETDGIYAFNNRYHRAALSGTVRLEPDASTHAQLFLHYADDDVHIPTDGSGALVDHNAFQFGQRLTLGLELRRAFSSRIAARLLVSGYDTDGGFDDAQDGPADTTGFYASNGLNHVVRRSVDLRADAYLTPAVVLTAGGLVEEERERSFSESQSEFGPSNSSFEVSRSTYAGYVQVLGVTGRVSWNLSGRADDNEAFGSLGTWRVGAAYLLPTATRLRGAVGSAFREPTFFQNYAQGFVRGNPDLRPEQARSWELGLEQQLLADRISLTATWFDQRFRDLIEFTFETATPTDPNYFNIAAAHARGLELELQARLPAGLSATAAHTWVDTRVTDPGFDQSGTGLFLPGAQLLRRPAHLTTLGLGWRAPGGAAVSLRALYFGGRDDIDFAVGQRVSLPAYTTVDLAGRADLLRRGPGRPGVALTLRLANALNERYDAVLGFPSPRRTLLSGVRLDL